MSRHAPERPLPLARNARIAVLGVEDTLGSALASAFESAGRPVVRLSVTALSVQYLSDHPDVVFVTMPWRQLRDTAVALAEGLGDAVIVVCSASLASDEEGYFMEPVPDGSVTKMAARLLPSSRIVGAFHQFGADAVDLSALGLFETDVPVVGDDREATDLVEALIDELPGLESRFSGGLDTSAAVEGLAAIVNQIARSRRAPVGFRIDGVDAGGIRFLD